MYWYTIKTQKLACRLQHRSDSSTFLLSMKESAKFVVDFFYKYIQTGRVFYK